MIGELQAMVGKGALKILPNGMPPAAGDIADTTTMPVELLHRSAHEALLSAENDSLRVLLEQAEIDAKALLAQAGIDAKEREAADKLQKLILRRTTSSHQEYAGHRQRHCLPESAQRAGGRTRAARDRRPAVGAGAGS
jgi:hypothetical protein